MNAIALPPVPHRVGLRAVDYLMLSDAGAFDHLGRTELIEGEIWAMNAVHSWHARTMVDVATELTLAARAIGASLRVFGGGSVLLSDDSVPEPDVSLAEDHDEGVLPLEKLKLAIEISDSTASIDLGIKLRLYAEAGVPEYWVVERETRVIHQFWIPSGEQYAARRSASFGERVESATLDGIAIDTASLR